MRHLYFSFGRRWLLSRKYLRDVVVMDGCVGAHKHPENDGHERLAAEVEEVERIRNKVIRGEVRRTAHQGE